MAIERLDGVAEATGKTRRVATPLLKMCGVVRFVPLARDNCDAANGLFDRFSADRAAAVSLLNSVATMNELVNSFQAKSENSTPVDWSQSISSMRSDLDEFETLIGVAKNSSLPSDTRAIAPIVSAYERAIGAEEDFVRLSAFVSTGVDVIESALELEKTANSAFVGISGGEGNLRDFNSVRDSLVTLEPSVREFRGDVQEFVDSTPDYLSGSGIESRVKSIGADAKLVTDLVLGITVPIEIMNDSFEEVRFTNSSLLESNAVMGILDGLIEEKAALETASVSLKLVRERLSGGPELKRLLGTEVADKLESILGNYSGVIETMAEASETLSLFLGQEGTKRYLVLGLSSDEIRAAGGFTSSVWVVTFDNGSMVETEYIDILKFGERLVLDDIPDPPAGLHKYMDANAWYLRDVGWSPDFRSVAETALLMNDAAGREPVNGVISLTQWAIIYLIEGMGGVDTSDGPLSGTAAMAAIESGTDIEGGRYLQDLFEGITDSLTVDRFERNFVDFSKGLLRAMNEKQIMIYSRDDDLQEKLYELGWSGAVQKSEGDFLGVFDSNIGWNKVGRNIDRSVQYVVDLAADGSGVVNVTVAHQNNSLVGECDVQEQPFRGGNRYDRLKDGCYWNLLRIYTPAGVSEIDFPELPLPVGAIAVQAGHLRAGVSTSELSWDESGQYIQALVVVPPQSTSSVTFEYELPSSTAIVSGDEIEYLLQVPVQAGIPLSDIEVTIKLPEGYVFTGSSEPSDTPNGSVFSYRTELSSDIELHVSARKSG
ncbi:DUF4012 domain-containing protein [Candidatus Lucifugimonas marina]|uniref:DUF4012 domain-containing protein n=1 Tax=Candidatus Lucifugimonas marina TaxID=3038979 RepID=A0AAJ5ZF23_9CHLR|nr:DUF4012 domain-containing protein [SAR202 cluster bacterium JH702]MDG0868251.1 DUF4012 domain-containing protein [SAR202 cluster bacterium JH639]WFG34895.1 DUF4012 domain-containing protein [SAR202 cluster bacterium JH545]WFG38846.1 DUF4012 domain-containing protein [SAR202 cluster bacterium JH1073]